MCDTDQLNEWAKRGLSRRSFGAMGAAATAAACAPMAGDADTTGVGSLSESTVTFAIGDKTMDGFFVHPAGKRSPAVIFWPDIAGIREAKRQMARRLAGEGYAVLLANPYYRDVAGEQFADFASFAANDGFKKVTPWREKFSAETIQRDARACAGWLQGQDAVDASRGLGTQGYCMTGSFAILGAAAVPQMKAAASFHGGGLVREGDTSPHRRLKKDADYLIAIAQNDDQKAPGDKTALLNAAEATGCDADIEVYPADHGWCVLDSPSYDREQAERAWAKLLAMYATAL